MAKKIGKLAILATLIAGALIGLSFSYFSPGLSLVILLVALFFGLALWKMELGIMMLAIYLPFELFLLKFVPDSALVWLRYGPEALIWTFFGFIILKQIFAKRFYWSQLLEVHKAMIIFSLVLIISSVINFNPLFTSLLGIRQILRFMALFLLVGWYPVKRAFIQRLILVLFILTVFEAGLGLAQAFIGAPLDKFLEPIGDKFFGSIQISQEMEQMRVPGQRIFATLGRYNHLGVFLCFFVLLAVGFIYEKFPKRVNWLIWLILAVSLPAMLFTYSRASWLGFAGGLMVIGILLKKDKRVLILASLAAVLFLGYYVINNIQISRLADLPSQTFEERFFEAFSPKRFINEYRDKGRIFFVVNTPRYITSNYPLFGVGPGQFGGGAAAALHQTAKYDEFGLPFGIWGSEGVIDNNWLSILAESGIIGFGLYIAIFYFLFSTVLKVYRSSEDRFLKSLSLGYLGSIFAFAFQGNLGTYFEMRTLAFYFWLFGGLIIALAEKQGLLKNLKK